MKRNGPLVVLWVLTIVGFGGALLSRSDLVIPGQLSAFVLAAITIFRTEKRSVLSRPLPYRITVGLLLAATVTVLVSAGSTVVWGDEHVPVFGFVGLSTASLLVSVLAWRALRKPSARYAAIVAFLAMTTVAIALVVDIALNLFRDWDHTAILVALIAGLASAWLAVFVSIASLLCFEPEPMVTIPEARVG